jgi:hypothetical protein
VPAASASAPLRLLEAVVEGVPGAAMESEPLCVQLPGGARVEVRDVRQAALAAELLRALAARSC